MILKRPVALFVRAILLTSPTFVGLALLGLPSQASTTVAIYTPSILNAFGATYSSVTYSPAQTFTPIAGGTLQRVTVLLDGYGIIPAPSSLQISVTATANGLPTTILAATTFSPAVTTTPHNFAADFSSANVNSTAGTLYAIVIGQPTDGGYGWIGDVPGSYAGGGLVDSSDSGASWTPRLTFDLGFSVVVVPEPSTMLLLFSCASIACLSRGARL